MTVTGRQSLSTGGFPYCWRRVPHMADVSCISLQEEKNNVTKRLREPCLSHAGIPEPLHICHALLPCECHIPVRYPFGIGVAFNGFFQSFLALQMQHRVNGTVREVGGVVIRGVGKAIVGVEAGDLAHPFMNRMAFAVPALAWLPAATQGLGGMRRKG